MSALGVAMQIKKSLIVIGVVFFFVACQQMAIVHDLSERDANEIIVLLDRNDIKADKIKEVRNQEVFWSVSVASKDTIEAQNVLVANQLPRVRQGGLEGICKNTSMIVTKDTEKCRMLLGLKGEIINSLQSIPGVSFADVVLNIPDKEEFPDPDVPQPRPTAAVTVRINKDLKEQTPLTEQKVQEFVANSISGMDTRDVAVIISYITQGNPRVTPNANQTEDGQTSPEVTSEGSEAQGFISVGGLRMAEKSAGKFKVMAALFLVVLLVLAGAFIFTLLKMSQLRKQAPASAETEQAGDKKLLEA